MAGELNPEIPQREQIVVPPAPEKIASPEIRAEQVTATPEKALEPAKVAEAAPAAPRPIAPATLSYQEQRAQAIDTILSEGLNEVFMKMDARQQQEFKKRGEETVKKINSLLDKTKVKVGKVIDLIRAWLKLIPGVNRFFVEQETKIKADKIMRIKDTL